MEIIKKNQNNWKRITIAIAGCFILAALLLFFIKQESGQESIVTLSPDGIVVRDERNEEYIIRQEEFDNGGDIDLRGDIVYETKEYAHVFSHEGRYKGKYFRTRYVDDSKKIRMQVTPNITPGDGIVESFLIVKIDAPHVIANIFLDSDWRDMIGKNATIIYGPAFNNQTPFLWNEIARGLYMTTIIQENAESFKWTAKYVPTINILVADRTRAEMYRSPANVTMFAYD